MVAAEFCRLFRNVIEFSVAIKMKQLEYSCYYCDNGSWVLLDINSVADNGLFSGFGGGPEPSDRSL